MMRTPKLSFATAVTAIATLLFNSCGSAGGTGDAMKAETDSLRKVIAQLTANDATIARNLDVFDTLDFTVFRPAFGVWSRP